DGRRFMAEYGARGERATRDIVGRAMFAEIKQGRATPLGGLYLQMSHLGPENVRRQFKGMVERCADCGFDLAGGRVEVIPTAHYMMGGLKFAADCATELPGLFAAGEDTGGVHGANRLGGNGVANSTVFGGIAGDSMARWVPQEGALRAPDEAAIAAAVTRATAPLARPAGDVESVRDGLYEAMWEDVGIVRAAEGLARGRASLARLDAALDTMGVAGDDRAFNLTWHDWLNLKNLILVSQAISAAAEARQDSRGAHWRNDFPAMGDLATSRYTCVRLRRDVIEVAAEPVAFARVRPGQSLIKTAAA
ncbi:MAG: FAD-binding protein, partial [Proteobacteria bacterium]|nr:FAD-binding protein [Pseudomonadota bacterium]